MHFTFTGADERRQRGMTAENYDLAALRRMVGLTLAVSLTQLISCAGSASTSTLPMAFNLVPQYMGLSARGKRAFSALSNSIHLRKQPRRAKALAITSTNMQQSIAAPSFMSPTYYPAADRIIAIGDVHGDARALRSCLSMSNLIDEHGNWVGGNTHLVQVGDIFDRGNEERQCLNILLTLKKQAEAAGGAVTIMLGNHEQMNADLDFDYVDNKAWNGWGTGGSNAGDEVGIIDGVPHGEIITFREKILLRT